MPADVVRRACSRSEQLPPHRPGSVNHITAKGPAGGTFSGALVTEQG